MRFYANMLAELSNLINIGTLLNGFDKLPTLFFKDQ